MRRQHNSCRGNTIKEVNGSRGYDSAIGPLGNEPPKGRSDKERNDNIWTHWKGTN